MIFSPYDRVTTQQGLKHLGKQLETLDKAGIINLPPKPQPLTPQQIREKREHEIAIALVNAAGHIPKTRWERIKTFDTFKPRFDYTSTTLLEKKVKLGVVRKYKDPSKIKAAWTAGVTFNGMRQFYIEDVLIRDNTLPKGKQLVIYSILYSAIGDKSRIVRAVKKNDKTATNPHTGVKYPHTDYLLVDLYARHIEKGIRAGNKAMLAAIPGVNIISEAVHKDYQGVFFATLETAAVFAVVLKQNPVRWVGNRQGISTVKVSSLNPLHGVPRAGQPINVIDDIASSILKKGYDLTEPISATRMPDGTLLITGGHHRLAALQKLSQKFAPVKIYTYESTIAKDPARMAYFLSIAKTTGKYTGKYLDELLPKLTKKQRIILDEKMKRWKAHNGY